MAIYKIAQICYTFKIIGVLCLFIFKNGAKKAIK